MKCLTTRQPRNPIHMINYSSEPTPKKTQLKMVCVTSLEDLNATSLLNIFVCRLLHVDAKNDISGIIICR